MGIGLKLMVKTNKNLNILSLQELSIQISLSGLSFCVLHRESNTITYLKYFSTKKKQNPFEALDLLKHAFNTEKELQNTFNSVTVIHENELSTLVPKPLFNEDNLADYLKFNAKILKSDLIAYDDLLINDTVNVYVPYVNINNFIYDTFGAFSFKHFSTILIDKILSIEKNAEDSKMYVNVSNSHFEIIVTNKSNLILYNTFEYTTKEDFIYYILFSAEQLELNPETINLILVGDIDKKDELYTITYKYIRNVSFGNRLETYLYLNYPKSNYSDFTLLNSFS